jgi:hypothetical protein
METLGAILIVVGFIAGIYGGLTLSRREVLLNAQGEVNQGKQFAISLLSGVSALGMLLGFLLFFGGL